MRYVLILITIFISQNASSKKTSVFFKVVIFNLISKEEKTYKIYDLEPFFIPDKVAGWDCRLDKIGTDGFKSLICEKGDELLATSVGCGFSHDRVNSIQLNEFSKNKIKLASSLTLICPAEQF